MAASKMLSTIAGPSRILTPIIVVWALICGSCAPQTKNTQSKVDDHPQANAREAADASLAAFQANDGERLAALAHPLKGVRFSPSAYVNVDDDIVLSRDHVAAFWTDSETYLWGYADGTRDAIELTLAAYADRYILDRDFSRSSTVTINEDRTLGTTRNNAADVYHAATRVEYYIEPSGGMAEGGTDWDALRLVLEKVDGTWFLIGVIRDSWSP